nr:hypothetical protein HmN_000995200 [Hymenolepis microstoma]
MFKVVSGDFVVEDRQSGEGEEVIELDSELEAIPSEDSCLDFEEELPKSLVNPPHVYERAEELYKACSILFGFEALS